MVQRQIVVVPPPGGDTAEEVNALCARLSAGGLAASSLALAKAGEAPQGARLVFLYRGAESVLVEAMAKGTQPSAAMGPWTRQAGRILAALADAPGAVTVDMADLQDQGDRLAALLAGTDAAAGGGRPGPDRPHREAAAEPRDLAGETPGGAEGNATGGEGPQGAKPQVRRTLTGDPVLRALARAALAEMPKARKCDRELNAAALLAGLDGPRADTAFLYYHGIARRPAEAEATERLEAECDRLREALAALEVELDTRRAAGPPGARRTADEAPAFNDPSSAGSSSATPVAGASAGRAPVVGASAGPLEPAGAASSVVRPAPSVGGSALAGEAPAGSATRIVLGETFTHPAFHDLEQSRAGRVFRWLGRADQAAIPTHTEIDGPVRIDVTVEVAVDEAALEGLRIGLNGTYAEHTELTALANGQRVKTAVFADAGGLPIEVWLDQRHAVDLSGKGDRRVLGCGIASIGVAPAGADVPERATAVRAAATLQAAAAAEPDVTLHDAAAAAHRPANASHAGLVREIVLTVDDTFDEPAFYPPETRPDGGRFAWMGRASEEWFPLTVALDRPIRVEAHLAMVIDQAALEGLKFTLDGREAETYQVEAHAGGSIKSATFAFDDPARTRPELVRLVLAATHALDMSAHGDERTLSVGLSKLVVTPL